MIKITYDKEKKGWFVEKFKNAASKRWSRKQFLKEPIPNFVPETKRKMFQEAKNQAE